VNVKIQDQLNDRKRRIERLDVLNRDGLEQTLFSASNIHHEIAGRTRGIGLVHAIARQPNPVRSKPTINGITDSNSICPFTNPIMFSVSLQGPPAPVRDTVVAVGGCRVVSLSARGVSRGEPHDRPDEEHLAGERRDATMRRIAVFLSTTRNRARKWWISTSKLSKTRKSRRKWGFSRHRATEIADRIG
jgi:hypothetical protein